MVLDLSKETELKMAQYRNNLDITEVYLPIIDEIPQDLFFNCINLKTVHIPEGVKIIGKWAFGNCDITEINFPETLVELREGCFIGNRYLKNLIIPSKVERVGINAFMDCTRVESLEIKGESFICKNAFRNMVSLRRVNMFETLPASKWNIEYQSFINDVNIHNMNGKIVDYRRKYSGFNLYLISIGVKKLEED